MATLRTGAVNVIRTASTGMLRGVDGVGSAGVGTRVAVTKLGVAVVITHVAEKNGDQPALVNDRM